MSLAAYCSIASSVMLSHWSPLDETHQLSLSFACNSFISAGFRQLFLLLQPSLLSLFLGCWDWLWGYFQSFQEKESWRHPSEYSLPKFGPFNLGGNSDRYCGIHCTYWTGPPGEVGFMWTDGQQRATMATENGLFVQIRPCINTTAAVKVILLTNFIQIAVHARIHQL